MPMHLIFLVIAFVLLLIAAALEWPRTNPPAPAGYGHPLGWFGLATFVLSFIVG